MIKLDNISLSFDNKIIFDNFSYTFKENEITILNAASGIGKTSLLNMLANLIKPDSGKVFTSNNISYLFQEDRLIPYLSVNDNLRFVLKNYDEKSLELVGMENEGNTIASNLSGGMKQRIALLKAILYAKENNCDLVLLDEPFKGLDLDNHNKMIELIKSMLNNVTIIISTHDDYDNNNFVCNKLCL